MVVANMAVIDCVARATICKPVLDSPGAAGSGLVRHVFRSPARIPPVETAQRNPGAFEKMAGLYKACGEQVTEFCEAGITVRTIH